MSEPIVGEKPGRRRESVVRAGGKAWLANLAGVNTAEWNRSGMLETLKRLQILAGEAVSLGVRLPELGNLAVGPDAELLLEVLSGFSAAGPEAEARTGGDSFPSCSVRVMSRKPGQNRAQDSNERALKVGMMHFGSWGVEADRAEPAWLVFSSAGDPPLPRIEAAMGELALVLGSRVRFEEKRARVLLLERFLATVAHELKGPLTALVGTLELELRLRSRGSTLEAATGLPPAGAPSASALPASPVLQRMLRELWRMNEMVQALMETALLRAGRFSVDRRPVRFQEWMDRLLEDRLRALADEFGVALDCRSSGIPEFVSMDPLRMEELVTNLTTFALRSSPEGEAVKLSWSAADDGNGIILSVEDRGAVLSDSERARLFTPFEAPVAVLKRGALGLALYLAREIALAHGGDLIAEGAGKGSGNRLKLVIPGVPPATAPGGTA